MEEERWMHREWRSADSFPGEEKIPFAEWAEVAWKGNSFVECVSGYRGGI